MRPLQERRRLIRERETKFLFSFNIDRLNHRLVLLLLLFITLNCLDALTTLVAIATGPPFVELNPIAAGLFGKSFVGFLAALSLKYFPMIPLLYATFLKESSVRPLAFRIVKVSSFIALAAADVFYLFVVISNVKTLATYFLFG